MYWNSESITKIINRQKKIHISSFYSSCLKNGKDLNFQFLVAICVNRFTYFHLISNAACDDTKLEGLDIEFECVDLCENFLVQWSKIGA